MNFEGTDPSMKSIFDPCRLAGRLFYLLVSLLLAAGVARALPPTTTTISEALFGSKSGADKKDAALNFASAALSLTDAVANKNIVDPDKFRDGLGKIIDGVVACLNASVRAKTS
jgi:hypothetical protein